jgi:putative SOS response-associated peptidase YedK
VRAYALGFDSALGGRPEYRQSYDKRQSRNADGITFLQASRRSTPVHYSADGFYEWRKEGRRKVPMWVHLKTKEPFALAGLWDVWRKPDGKRLESFTIITTEPNELVRPVHNRMPVILRAEDEEQRLDASRTPFVKAKSVLKSYPDELMDAHDISPIVNSAKHDGPECIQPVADDDIPRAGQLSLL